MGQPQKNGFFLAVLTACPELASGACHGICQRTKNISLLVYFIRVSFELFVGSFCPYTSPKNNTVA